MEAHKITTIQEMFDIVTVENWERFSADIMKLLYDTATLKQQLKKDFPDYKGVKAKYIYWIDDGLSKTNFTIAPSNEECDHKWFRTTKNHKPAKKCTECREVRII
jgi:hypothetical protein